MYKALDSISRHLPIDSNDNENVEYLDYLKNAYQENIGNGKFQFALLAFHMMFMSYIYKQFWCLKEFDFLKVKKFCDNNKQLLDMSNVYDMSILSEKSSIDFTMNALGFHVNRRSDVQLFVDTRDKCAHASGFIQYREKDVENHFEKVLEYINQISEKTKASVQLMFEITVHEYWSSDTFDRTLSVQHAEKIIKQLNLSPVDIEHIFEIDTSKLLINHSWLSSKISIYLILLVLQHKYRESNEDYKLPIDEIYYVTQLSYILESIQLDEFGKIEIELEDELNALSDRYPTIPLEELREKIEELREKIERSKVQAT